jgi:hypothetical protein
MSKISFLITGILIVASYGCGASDSSKGNSNGPVEIKLDPKNMPEGLSVTPLPTPADGKLPEGITIDGTAPAPGRTATPGLPSADQLKKGIKPSARSTPGIPDAETIRKQMGYPSANVNLPPKGEIMMKGNRKLGGKPQ